MKTTEIVTRIKRANAGELLDPVLADQLESRYRAIDWEGLERHGYSKKGDYCFIYSYPPVRSLKEIDSSEIFARSVWEPAAPRLNVYLHIPYCSGICSYCYFAKVVDSSHAPVKKDDYIELLIWELQDKYERYNPDSVIDTVHFGGGTPSILEPRQIQRIMRYLRSLNLASDAEITWECAPETICDDVDKLRLMRDEGVNRINLGVESLEDEVLRLMARRHTADETRRAFENLRRVGFDNVAADLIYAVPGQTIASWSSTLRKIAALRPESISCYRLRTHPMKAISKMTADVYTGYVDGLKQQLAHSIMLEGAGYLRVSSQKYAARAETINRQTELKRAVSGNQLLSAGCGAYGYLNSTFYWNTKSLDEYGRAAVERRHPTWIGQRLGPDEIMRKAMVLGMHVSAGVDLDEVQRKFDVDPSRLFAAEIAEACELGLLRLDGSRVRPTDLGYFFGDELSVKFYSPAVREQLDGLGMKYGMFWERDRYA